jgi:hypothetical protein
MNAADGLFPAMKIRDAIGALADGRPIDARLVPFVHAAIRGLCPTSDLGERQFVIDIGVCGSFNMDIEELIWPHGPDDDIGEGVPLRLLTDSELWEATRRRWDEAWPREWTAFIWRVAVPLSNRLAIIGAWRCRDQAIRAGRVGNRFVERAYQHPPHCVGELRVAPAPLDSCALSGHSEYACFSVACACGSPDLALLGYFVDRPKDGVLFTGPHRVRCSTCAAVTELMDPRQHGFLGEQKSDCNVTGEGEAQPFLCPGCGKSAFRLTVVFGYNTDDLFDEHCRMFGERVQDFFGGFAVYATCTACGHHAGATGFECS